MKKVLKTLVLLPMWPLIWLKMGFDLQRDCWGDGCQMCGGGDGCCQRAHAMVNWWRS